jgi:hypothetical protein
MRRLVAAGLCAALQVGAFTAPLVHAHLDDHHDDHHDAAAVHAHFAGHARGPATAGHHVHAYVYVASGFSRTNDQPALGAHDDAEEITRLQIFIAETPVPSVTPALPPARFAPAPEPVSVMRRRPDVVRSHGPPRSGPTSPRAPPAPSV